MKGSALGLAAAIGVLCTICVSRANASPRTAQPALARLLQKVDDMMRGESSEGVISMRVQTARWQRTLRMEVRSEGTDKTLIRVLSPPKERGTATLKVGTNIWNYLPKVDRTIRVPASMMSGSWMGSHFTNDDLVKHARLSEDFDCRILEKAPTDGDGSWLIECKPKPEAPVVWGKLLVKVRSADELVQEVSYYDEEDQLVRRMVFSDIGNLGGRRVPRRVKVIPADKPDEFTEIVYEKMQFGIVHPPGTFTLRALRR